MPATADSAFFSFSFWFVVFVFRSFPCNVHTEQTLCYCADRTEVQKTPKGLDSQKCFGASGTENKEKSSNHDGVVTMK